MGVARRCQGHCPFLLTLLAAIATCSALTQGSFDRNDNEGPSFFKLPSDHIDFSNGTGARVECKAEGNPSPTITWLLSDGSPVTPISDLRKVTDDGTLVFLPFSAQNYRQDVHAVTYKCAASNIVGTIISAEFKPKAVIDHIYEVYVYDSFVIKGNTGIMKCHVPAFLTKYIKVSSWLRDDRFVINNTDFNLDNKYVIAPNGDLYIRDVDSKDHNSIYRCQILHTLTNVTKLSSYQGKLIVAEGNPHSAPRFDNQEANINSIQGANITVPCSAQANPAPEIKWFKKSFGQLKEIASQQSAAVLILNNVQLSDSGIYICTAENQIKKEVMEFTITVNAPLKVSVNPKNIVADVGRSFSISCDVSGGLTRKTVWLKNGKPISGSRVTLSDHSFTVNEVSTTDKGMYQCMVTNDYMTAFDNTQVKLGDSPPELMEVFSEQTFQPGSSMSIKCVAAGTPLPEIKWYLDNDLAITDNIHTKVNGRAISWLNITNMKPEDGGTYSCLASNKVGTDKHSSRINVYGSVTSRQLRKLSVTAGSFVEIYCPIFGYPIGQITWTKGKHLLPRNRQQRVLNNGTLHITTIRNPDDSGQYSCFSVNSNGEKITAIVDVHIMVPPKIIPFSFQEDLVREGMRARIQCVVSEGDFPLNIEWTKDGHPLPQDLGITVRDLDEFSSILTISAVGPKHNGEYVCTARNDAATSHHSAKLAVNVPPKIITFAFQDDQFFKGMRAHIICAVSQGDLPISFQWLKDNQPIPSSLEISIRSYDDHTNSLSIESVTSAHTGNYTCVASNRAAIVSYTAPLLVYVAPKISPFTFPEDTRLEGSFARVTCLVYQGDLPLALKWFKDNERVYTNSGITTKRIDEYSSILTIAKVEMSHSGNYTCVASNAAASISYSAQLRVNAPPRWITIPSDQTVVKNKPLTIDCQAEGFPKPEITWKKSIGKSVDDEEEPVLTGNNIEILKNGSLHFYETSLQNEGYYFCYASNGVGMDINTVVHIEVRAPVYFLTNNDYHMAKQNSKTLLLCKAYGDSPITFMWKRNDELINAETSTHFSIRQYSDDAANVVVNELTLDPVVKKDEGIYACFAQNIYGNDTQLITVTVQVPPSDPEVTALRNLGNRSVEISWSKPNDGHSPITNYSLHYKKRQDSWSARSTAIIFNSTVTTATVRDLSPATIYEFRLTAANNVGVSEPSNIMTVVLGEEAPSGPPEQVEVESVDPQTLRVSWKPPRKSLWNGVIRGYYIGYKIHGTSNPYIFTTLEVPEDYTEDLIYQLNNLNMYTQYSIIVQAYNSGGRSPSSEEYQVMTSEAKPSKPPQGIRCSSLSSRSIYVVWNPPPADALHGILRGYKVLYKAVEDGHDGSVKVNTTTLPKGVLVDLEVDSNYSIQVLAFTKLGDGVRSEPIFCKTYEDVPGSPDAVKALPSSEDSILVSWTPPKKPNGIITKYNLYYTIIGDGEENKDFANKDRLQGISVHTLDSETKYYEVKGLLKNNRYAFWLTALSAIGEGPISAVMTQTTAGTTVPAKSASFDDNLKTQWKKDVALPCRAVGVPSPDQKWFQSGKLIQENERILVRFDGTLIIKKSEKHDSGNYTCRVHNKYGSDEVHYSVKIVAPPDVPILEVLSKTLTSVRLHWKAGAGGGEPITGYVLHFKRETSQWETKELSAAIHTDTLDNLSCGATYQLYLEAKNIVGIGKPCETITVTTHGETFQLPSKEALLEEGMTFVTVHFDSWPSTGCPIQKFAAEYKKIESSDWILVSNNIKPSQRKFVVSGMMPATWYVIRVTSYTSTDDFNVGEYIIGTLTLNGGTIPPNVDHREEKVILFYLDPWIFIPVVLLIIICIITSVIVFIYCKRKPSRHNEEQVDWTQYMGTLARPHRQLGTSVESFVQMPKGRNADATLRRQETLWKNGDPNPYATIRLPECESQMTLMMANCGAVPTRIQNVPMVPPDGWIPVLPATMGGMYRRDGRTIQKYSLQTPNCLRRDIEETAFVTSEKTNSQTDEPADQQDVVQKPKVCQNGEVAENSWLLENGK